MNGERLEPLLMNNDWFGRLPEDVRAEISKRAASRTILRNDYLFSQGEASSGLHCVIAGQIHVGGISADGDELLIGILRPGDWSGFLAMLDGGEYAFSARAALASSVLTLSPADTLEIFERDVATYKLLVAPELSSARGTFRFYLEQFGKPPMQRVASRLIDLGRWPYSPPSGPLKPLENVKQDDLAAATRLSRQTINGVLREFHRREIIELGRSSVRVKDIDALGRISRGT